MKKLVCIIVCICCLLPLSAQERGYEKTIEVEGSVGLDEYSKFAFGASMINGYRVNPYFFAGAGVGFKYFDTLYYTSYSGTETYNSYDGKYLMPIWLRLKANFTDTRISPYAIFDCGWTFDVGKNEYTTAKGPFIEPQLGLDFKLEDDMALYCSVGYNLQRYQYTSYNISSSSLDTCGHIYYIGTISFHFGVKF